MVRDARGEQRSFVSNETGNFWAPSSAWTPTFPLRVELRAKNRSIAMRTEIAREGACNACHRGVGDARHMPGVFVEGTAR